MDALNTVFQFNVMQNLRTGNPIIDVIISGAVLSLLTYLITNYTVYLCEKYFFDISSRFGRWLGNVVMMKSLARCPPSTAVPSSSL